MITVFQSRGACIEAEFPCSAVAVRENQVVWSAGTDRVTTFRSASKPFQLACSLEALGDPALEQDALAVGAASHSAEPQHLAVVQSLLDRFHARAEDLRCGAHAPMHAPSAEAVLRAGGAFTDLHNNCSGKHAFMLAAAQRNGWALDYRPLEHPLQQVIAARLGGWMQCAPDTALDGCGVPTFIQPLSAVARAWSVLACAMDDVAQHSARDAWAERLGAIGLAMAARPEMSSGTGRLDLEVVRAARETMAVKIGAMGLFCIALPARRTGLAVKVHAGAGDALPALVKWALERAAPDAWSAPQEWNALVVRNVVGLPVGNWTASGRG